MTKTCIYIDGYNLYYSRLKGSKFKWLDIVTLFRDHILKQQDPNATVVAIKYFTAPIRSSYARHGRASEHAQTQYHRALEASHPGMIEIIKGFHVLSGTLLPKFEPGVDASKDNMVPVWMIEEKQTDVNVALHAYRDAIRGTYDQIVICSNDSDLEPAMRMVRDDASQVTIGLVIPLRKSDGGKFSNKRLTALAHWKREYINDDELEKSQLPKNVPTTRKPASKPAHWE